jgi:hypothetical protein
MSAKGELKLRKCDGYIYLDMLAALSVCLFIALSLLPIIDQIKLDQKNILLRVEAQYVLYEKLTALLDGEMEAVPMDIVQQNYKYTLTWRVPKDFPEMVEGCIQYENASGRKEMVCDATKK